ncbi:uncharacterized protein LOC143290087 [Babylonia areolata]|uniref:uncharacterized protein LOC143290087 n=1 Tax=Babylonia areolata TaxID=304850 RepID=UPI003FD43191
MTPRVLQPGVLALLLLCLRETASAAQGGAAVGHLLSCADVLRASGQPGRTAPQDGEYLLSLPPYGAVSIFCAGFDNGHPREYLTLVSGRSNNIAEIYSKQGLSKGGFHRQSLSSVYCYVSAASPILAVTCL